MEFELLLPSQHFAQRRKQAPEHHLMMAVLEEALGCVEKNRASTNTHGRRLYREARQWFLVEQADWPYSFERICGVLDLDADAVRESLGVVAHDDVVATVPRATAGSVRAI